MPSKCCVPLCEVNQRPLHKFPPDEQIFRTWCTNIGRENLLQRGLDAVRKSYRVCDVHFADIAKFPTVRNRTNLKVGSIPTLHLPLDPKQMINATSPVTACADAEGIPALCSKEESVPGEPDVATESVAKATSLRKRTPSSSYVLRKRRNLLLEVNLRKQAQLTPKACKLYHIANEYKDVARKLQQVVISNKERVEAAIKEAESGAIFQNKINSYTYNFLLSQITQQRKLPRGRRYSREDKILALALLKQGPRNYKLLRKIFAVPSRKTLMSLLSKVPFDCGINLSILENLRRSVQQLNPRGRHCVLMFDEISLQPSLQYHKGKETIEGFQKNTSEGDSSKIADHAMVFMLKGVAKKWKQPIAFFFSQNGMANAEIAKYVKIFVHHLLDMGFVVNATICDQYNKAAINMLVQETKMNAVREGRTHEGYSFLVDGEEIFPLFDFPHLLKGIRNNMLKYDLRFRWKLENEQVATWRHVEQLYEIDFHADDDFRMLSRLTDAHVDRKKIKKMKVKYAAQVFSHRVQSTMRVLVTHGREGLMPDEAIGTANFVLFMDKLFDSANGSSVQPKDGKILRRAVTKATEHVAFWREAIKVLESMKFFGNGKEFVPPTVTNWILSLRNMNLLWQKLQLVGFEFLLPRNFNQDPLENFFSSIRSHGVRNVNPSCTAFKTLIINNFMASHSLNANCEEDHTEGALDSLGYFLDPNNSHVSEDHVVPLNYGDTHRISLKSNINDTIVGLHGYLAESIPQMRY